MNFAPAVKSAAFLKLAVTGPSGSGKTEGALRIARGLVGPKGRIGVIDTEHRSASLYSDRHRFDVLNLDPPYDAPSFAEAIRNAVEAKFDVLIVDTLSHAWEAVLDFKDALDRRGGSSFSNWNAAGEKWREVVSELLNSKLHVIACLRSKTDYVLETNEKGKSVPRKVGLAPITRDGTEYEFTLVWDLDMGHRAMASKDRTRMFDGKPVQLTEAEGVLLAEWLKGVIVSPPLPAEAKPEPAPEASMPFVIITPETQAKIEGYWKALGKDAAAVPKAVKWTGCKGTTFGEMSEPEAQKLVAFLQTQMNALAAQKEAATPAAGLEDPKVEPPTPAEKPVEAKVPADLAVWLGQNETDVNAYLRRVGWINETQTWRTLPQEKVTTIAGRTAQFARAAGIPQMGGAK